MRPILTAILSLFLATPTLGTGQAPAAGPKHQPAFETLKDSQWVRVASSELGRREGRLLQRRPTELILSSGAGPEPLRVPAAAIDTLWTRGHSTKTGAIVGALLGAGIGALAAASVEVYDTDPAAVWGVSVGGGTVVGGLVGILLGASMPRWERRFP